MYRLKQEDLTGSFPTKQYKKMLANQEEALEMIADQNGSVTLELPTGSGKTAVGYTFLAALAKRGEGPLFYITPTKTLVEQVKVLHHEVHVAYGRGEHSCFYYKNEDGEPLDFRADEIPCSMLMDCPHRVNQETGETFASGAAPCPYLKQKYEAKQARVVVSTTAFYLFTQLFSQEWSTPAGLVIDEAHKLAHVVRSLLSYEITDWHLKKSAELLEEIEAPEAEMLARFYKRFIRIVKRRPAYTQVLLTETEISDLMEILADINPRLIRTRVEEAIKRGVIDTREKRETLKKIEVLTRDLSRYLHSLEYALPGQRRNALNYVFAFWKAEKDEHERVQYRLCIKSYYVAPIIKKILSPRTVAYSATIGDSGVFGFETGIEAPFYTLGSDFPAKNTRIFMPTDTPNLAMKSRNRQDLPRTLRKIAEACKELAKAGIRSLVVVVSEREHKKFVELADEVGLKAVSYGNGIYPREAAKSFKDGSGDVLVGTVSNYGEGVDLPRALAPVIFFLRPSYPSPYDPQTQYEEARFRNQRWKVWNWRVMVEALQVRGRNIRSSTDVGVTFFISQQFRRFVYGTLPAWLQDAYRGQQDFDECVKEARDLLA